MEDEGTVGGVIGPISAEDVKKSLKVRSNVEAKYWTDAFPIGNGRLGGMIWGGVSSETINLNDDTLWTGSPGNYTNPDAPKALSEVRKLVDDGKYAEATTSAVQLSGEPSAAYQLLGDINLEFDNNGAAYDETTYQRELDLNTATVKIRYYIGEVEFTREHFASYPDQVIVSKISANKSGSLSFAVSLTSKLPYRSSINAQNQIVMERAEDDDKSEKIQFSATLDLRISDGVGTISVTEDNKLNVKGCDWAVILLTASSSFEGPFTKPSESIKNPTYESLNTLNSLKDFSYEQLYARHLDDYQKLFHRVSIDLSKNSDGEENTVATSERVKSFKTDEDPSLIELLFQYGRYLLISCSRPGTQPANLQGIWNDKVTPPWDGAPHLNINLQMNYWPSLSCNLRECQEPLFDYIESLSVNGTKTANVNYEASGWVVHQVSDIWAKTSPDRGEALWALWPMGGAWLCTHLWEHYTYTMNKDLLATKAYPLLEGCVSFLLDWLIEGPEGYLQTNPSTSPEHMFTAPDGQPASVSYSTTMDMSIIKEVFSAIVSAAQDLGKGEDDLIKKVVEAQTRLYPTKISKDGSIMEWAQDFEDPDVHHRHISHLFGLFPGHTITLEKTPDLCKAADVTLNKRGATITSIIMSRRGGSGMVHYMESGRVGPTSRQYHAYRMVKHLFDLVDPENEANYEGGLYSNLFTAHPPFQIDANFGFSAAIAEIVIQSTVNDIYLLPALPRDKWGSGSVKGLKARGNVTVSVTWTDGELHELSLWSPNDKDLDTLESKSVTKTIHYKETSVVAKLSKGKVYTFDKELRSVKTDSLLNSSSN